jgi:cation diffusion facilitator CzcD-associated flavoprotein CzcO
MVMMTSAISPKRVAIVGAGASGIPAAKFVFRGRFKKYRVNKN